MSNTSKKEFVEKMRFLYLRASKTQKQGILDNVCSVCGYNRKYAIRLLNQKPSTRAKKRPGRKKSYHAPELIEVLTELWVKTNLPCAKDSNMSYRSGCHSTTSLSSLNKQNKNS